MVSCVVEQYSGSSQLFRQLPSYYNFVLSSLYCHYDGMGDMEISKLFLLVDIQYSSFAYKWHLLHIFAWFQFASTYSQMPQCLESSLHLLFDTR